jgi:bifunctional non-homologous end joining protein LigD
MPVVKVARKNVTLSNLDKVLYPSGFTKAQIIDYYSRIAPVILPHLKGRGITLKRYPSGTDESHFFEKQCPDHRPPWIKTASVPRRSTAGEIDYCLIGDEADLVWLANLAAIEIHVPLAKARDWNRPTEMVFDLDPGEPADISDCAEIALVLRGMFDQLGLQSFAKTTGSKGLQVYVPLNSNVTYDQTKPFARQVAELLEQQMPDRVTADMAKSKRRGKVLVDWSQNEWHKSTVAAYSLRARERPTVSTPVTWDEVDAGKLDYDHADVVKRLDKHGDLFAPVLTTVQALPA